MKALHVIKNYILMDKIKCNNLESMAKINVYDFMNLLRK